WLAGWKCAYVPGAIVHHKVSGSIGHLSANTVYYFSRNSLWAWVKNVPVTLMLRLLPQRLIYEVSAFSYYCLIHGKIGPYLRGKWDGLKGAGAMWRKRKELQALRRLTNGQIIGGLMPISRYLFERLRGKGGH
ncbi:MAG: hypothetical protein LUO80_01900, partial [Methylococcaceae bacterium]|nr:hypothetical protein [Methylococcaceae bacterium]